MNEQVCIATAKRRCSMPAGSITVGSKSVTLALGAASLCRGTIATASLPISHYFHGCESAAADVTVTA